MRRPIGARQRAARPGRRIVAYQPDCGDFIWLDFDPQAGREQAGRRPALVLSPRSYNAKSGLALVCPITSHVKGYPFEVVVPGGLKIRGAVLSDHLRSLDWNARRATFESAAPNDLVLEVLAKVEALLQINLDP